jgi:C4-dicarboxylate transporter, DctQ subunit
MGTRLVKKLSAAIGSCINFAAYAGTVMLVFLMSMVGIGIFSRYVLRSPIGWVNEMTEYILVYLGFLAAAWVLKDEGHIKMDLVLNAVSPRTQCMMNAITSIICTIACSLLTWYSFKVTLKLYQTGYLMPTIYHPPKFILIAGIFIGMLLFSVQLIVRTYTLMGKWKASSTQKSVV